MNSVELKTLNELSQYSFYIPARIPLDRTGSKRPFE